MRYQNGLVTLATVLLSMVLLTAFAYIDQFPQAARAESVGFDALAHDLFGGAVQAEAAPLPAPVVTGQA
jgi:hypothetical protein